MALLARREHSSLELEQKLERRFPEKIDKINTLEDIPKVKIFELIERMKKIKKN